MQLHASGVSSEHREGLAPWLTSAKLVSMCDLTPNVKHNGETWWTDVIHFSAWLTTVEFYFLKYVVSYKADLYGIAGKDPPVAA